MHSALHDVILHLPCGVGDSIPAASSHFTVILLSFLPAAHPGSARPGSARLSPENGQGWQHNTWRNIFLSAPASSATHASTTNLLFMLRAYMDCSRTHATRCNFLF
jgi:hypothetical protein